MQEGQRSRRGRYGRGADQVVMSSSRRFSLFIRVRGKRREEREGGREERREKKEGREETEGRRKKIKRER